ncbi:MAG: hypothetical protein WDN00_17095 [Limisphaerales bacterium]
MKCSARFPAAARCSSATKAPSFSPDDYGEQFFVKLKGEKKFTHFKKSTVVAAIPEVIPRNPFKGDNDLRQHLEWIAAIKANKPEDCYSRFAVGAQLTEIMLLGCVSLRTRQENHVGRAEDEGHQLSGGRAVRQTRIS